MPYNHTESLCGFLADVPPPPSEVVEKTKQHIIDTVGAAVSGARLKPGLVAAEYVKLDPGCGDATVIGAPFKASARNAAFANGMSSHADETDDSHFPGFFHPGCAIVPAALAAAEARGASGETLIRAVAAGYDVGARFSLAMNLPRLDLQASNIASHTFGPFLGATAAAAVASGLSSLDCRHVLSYAGQMASGVTAWLRDLEHIEKAFVFGGLPAQNGVWISDLVGHGFTGLLEPLTGGQNFVDAHSNGPADRDILTDGLGENWEIMRTNIKKFSVGSPIQAAADALESLQSEDAIAPDSVREVVVTMPTELAHVVNKREMPDINLQYIVTVMLQDGGLSFKAAHDYERFMASGTKEYMQRILLKEDPEMAQTRQAVVEIIDGNGSKRTCHVRDVRGTKENPMVTAEVVEKAARLMDEFRSEDVNRQLIDQLLNLEEVDDVRSLSSFLAA